MIPTKSTASDPGCIPVSSDCVIWQGPNIPCINLCSGDAISEVTYKIADKLCSIQSVFDLTALQLGDLTAFCASVSGAPTGSNKTILANLDFIFKKLVCVMGKVDNLPPLCGVYGALFKPSHLSKIHRSHDPADGHTAGTLELYSPTGLPVL